jgi:hypothetical protein
MPTVTPIHSSHPPKRLSPRPPKRQSGRSPRRKRLGELLVLAGKIGQEDMNRALEEQRLHRGKRLGEILIAAPSSSPSATRLRSTPSTPCASTRSIP